MEEHQLLRRAALAVVRSIDHEASFYEAQSPVEDWALAALQAAVAVAQVAVFGQWAFAARTAAGHASSQSEMA